MTVYVDRMRAPLGRMRMSHLLADGDGELLAMASRLGLRQYVHRSRSGVLHLDVCQSKRAEALKLGAKEIGRREVARLVRRHRERA